MTVSWFGTPSDLRPRTSDSTPTTMADPTDSYWSGPPDQGPFCERSGAPAAGLRHLAPSPGYDQRAGQSGGAPALILLTATCHGFLRVAGCV